MIGGLLVVFGALVPPAGAHPLEGVWQISYPWHIEHENGVPKPTMESGRMTVTAAGDSLVATIITDPSPMFPSRRPLRLATMAGPGPVSFEMRGQVDVTTSNGRHTMTDVVTWVFHADGDQLRGTMERRIIGMGKSSGPLALSGTRMR